MNESEAPVLWLDHTGSTQQEVLDGAAHQPADWPHGRAVATLDQRGGRGRLGRSWTTPRGGAVALSVLLRPRVASVHWSWCTLVGAAAVVRLLRTLGVPALIKWPNDVLVDDGRKVCGILATVLPGGGGLVLGMGLNLDFGPDDPPVPTAASIAEWCGPLSGPDRERWAHELRGAVLEAIDDFQHRLGTAVDPVDGTHPAVRGVTDLLDTLGRSVRAELPDGTELVGVARGLGVCGTLLIEPDGDAPTAAPIAAPAAGMPGDAAEARGRMVEITAADVVHLRGASRDGRREEPR